MSYRDPDKNEHKRTFWGVLVAFRSWFDSEEFEELDREISRGTDQAITVFAALLGTILLAVCLPLQLSDTGRPVLHGAAKSLLEAWLELMSFLQ